jgi:hypothetical protein
VGADQDVRRLDEEEATYRLIDAGCEGLVETDLYSWRPREEPEP